MNTILPRFAGGYISEFPFAAQRLYDLAAKDPLLSAGSEATFAADQTAAERVRNLEGSLAREQARPKAERDLDAEKTLQTQLVAAREARVVSEQAAKHAVAVSHGSRCAHESTVKLVAGTLAGENAKLEQATVALPKRVDLDYVLEQRAAIERLDEEAKRKNAAIPPKKDILARALSEVSAVAKRGAIKVAANGSLILPETPIAALPLVGGDVVKVDEAFAIIASLFESRVVQQVEAAIEARYRDIPKDLILSASEKKAVVL
jgi:hypothetical protein